jgi:hypothetical protein
MRLVPERKPVCPGRLVHPAAFPTRAAAIPSEYDGMEDTRQMAATRTGTGPSPRLSDSPMDQLREAGHMPMMEFCAEGYRQAGSSGSYYQPPITEPVLFFALTRLPQDAERTLNSADVMRAKWTDSEAEVRICVLVSSGRSSRLRPCLTAFRSFRTLLVRVRSARIGSEDIEVFDGRVW